MLVYNSNRDYIITYYRLDIDNTESKRVHTMKELLDWFNNDLEGPAMITNIEEIPGKRILDKYYKKGEEA